MLFRVLRMDIVLTVYPPVCRPPPCVCGSEGARVCDGRSREGKVEIPSILGRGDVIERRTHLQQI